MSMTGLLAHLRDSLYQPACAACDTPLAAGQAMCATCAQSCEAIDTACPSCALPLAGQVPLQCSRCRKHPIGLDSCTAAFEYGGQLRTALMRLKYGRRSDVARTLMPLLAPAFARAAARATLALAVPLHPSRLGRRGFNQSQRLLLPLARLHELPVARDALFRIRDTPAQARLDARARRANLRGAFRADSKLAGARILVLDDVLTTGETMRALARSLRRAGADQVHGFVVARAECHGS